MSPVLVKWRRRRHKEPFKGTDFEDAAFVTLRFLFQLMTNDVYNPEHERYFEPGAKVIGVWGIGSGVAGRWKKDSDIDIWIHVDCLTKLGEKYADQAIVEMLETEGIRCWAGGRFRKIDVVILDRPPGTDWPILPLNNVLKGMICS
jgi:hypothetical protein